MVSRCFFRLFLVSLWAMAGNPIHAAIMMDGQFGKAAGFAGEPYSEIDIRPEPAFNAPEKTIEFWVKLSESDKHQVPVARGPKAAGHWEVYTTPGTGYACTYCTDLGDFTSTVSITDDQWHFISLRMRPGQITLAVDGAIVIDQKPAGTIAATEEPITVGGQPDGTMIINGSIDDLRISKGYRTEIAAPTGPLGRDEDTIQLWNFDDTEGFPPQQTMSLDAIDKESFRAGPGPLDSDAEVVPLIKGAAETPAAAGDFSLDGPWQLAEGETADGGKQMNAVVPGSVHQALFEAGLIPNPYFGRNQELVRPWSFKTYWYQKTFVRPPKGQDSRLVFEGVCNRSTFWLNGKELGSHEGMFDRIEFPIEDLLQENNTLLVKLDPAIEWTQTVVFNNSYGWHYSKFPPLGIWRSVKIGGEPAVRIRNPLVATRDARAGVVDMAATIAGPADGWAGKLIGGIQPDNFKGQAYHFEYPIRSRAGERQIHLRVTIPDPQLWWPVDMGKPNLYQLTLAYLPDDSGEADVQQIPFGIRTVQMAPVNGKPHPRRFNWTFVINGKPMFVKGSGWCTCDAMLDFSRSRYDRFLTMAASQHIQMLRAWGSGMVETDDFYDLCDRKGIMVMQEWPTAWNSHNTQPFELLERTVRDGTLRLRNHPSLVIYTGGNESSAPFGPAIDRMGRLSIELDGTRAFHRGEPFGGSVHDYTVYWGGQHIDHAFTMEAIFYGEFGIASYPCYESVQRFLPDEEKNLWPAPADKSFAYHTPIFNTADDLNRLTRMSQYFTEGTTMERFIIGTQLAQAAGVRHALERARTRWPKSTGALYYKLNDNCPAASWATVDWYGVPKISHYLIQDSFAPLAAVVLFPKAGTYGEPLQVPVFLLDDADVLNDSAWEVIVRAFGANLELIQEKRFPGNGTISSVLRLGEFALTAAQTQTAPLLVVTDVMQAGTLMKRNYYFTNFEPVKDCLFNLPKTILSIQIGENQVNVRNEGSLPAVGVNISCPGHLDTFIAEDNYFWLDPGETMKVAVSTTDRIEVRAWNSPAR